MSVGKDLEIPIWPKKIRRLKMLVLKNHFVHEVGCFLRAGHILCLLLTLSAHAREGYSSHFVCVSVCFFIVEKAPFSGLKLTSVHSR